MDTPLDAVWRERARILLEQEPRGEHLSDEVWLALAERRPVPGDAGEVLEHLTRCAACRDALRAVRLLDRERAGIEPRSRLAGLSTRLAWAATVAATLVTAGGLWMVTSGRPVGRSSSASGPATAVPVTAAASEARPASPATSPAPPAWLQLTAPAIAIYSPDVLTMRGASGQPFADAFATAMQPWRAGRFAEAAEGLAGVTAAHPAVAEGHFYRGVALLLAGTPAAAIAPLERATDLAPDRLAPEAWWYLGVARYQQGQRPEAARAFSRACRLGRVPACEASEALSQANAPPP